MNAVKAIYKAVEFVAPIVKTWRQQQIGKRLTRRLFPKMMKRVDERRAERDAQRKRQRAEADAAGGEFFHQPDEDQTMLPKNTMRKTGVALVGLSPIVAIGLAMFGIGECTPEQVEVGCVGAEAIAAGLLSSVGGLLYWVGFNRAKARGE